MTKRQRALPKRCEIALTDWMRQYAPEQCYFTSVAESRARVMTAGGTLAYIEDLLQDITKELRK